ncbi:hypothetical protein [uncultured Treponema sp.]|uniref:hypothetical protein n=1 Tax=uncultured Treponema sp. TaxID=162155 RepID=UPI0025FF91F4|nr:hypothetical protein [uncultured Treponema sp.]
MKKIFSLFVFFISLFSASAMSDFSNRTFCMGLSFPNMKHDYRIDGMDAVTLNGIGLNFNVRRMKDEMKLGIFLDTDIFMPISKTIVVNEQNMTTSKITDYEFFFGIDALAGIYTVLFRDASLNFPVGLGFHLDGFISKEKYDDIIIKESVYTLGAGLWLNLEINVSKRFGVYLGSKFIYDFYYKMNNKSAITTVQSGNCRCFSAIPTAGVLWRF